jgi:integrase
VGVAEGLRRWRRRFGDKAQQDVSILVAPDGTAIDRFEAARSLREHLRLAGVSRRQLFETDESRMAIRAHDLRATFITVNLALGKTEAWITDRTGHRSSQMIYTYKRAARTLAELNLGGFTPLHEAIPELRK